MWVIYTILALVWTMTLLDVFVPDWQKGEGLISQRVSGYNKHTRTRDDDCTGLGTTT